MVFAVCTPKMSQLSTLSTPLRSPSHSLLPSLAHELFPAATMVNWFPLESNPEVLTTYSSSLGLKSSYVFSDLVALEDWAFAMLPGKCEAVVFLYSLSQPQREYHDNFIPPEGRDSTSSLFRVQQNVGNACGTIGVLHSIGSVRSKYSDCLEEGSWFETFFNKCEGKVRIGEAKDGSASVSYALCTFD